MSADEAQTEAHALPKTYEPASVEGAIYRMWIDRGAFAAIPDERPPERRHVIMMPLPNVTGALHMGHAMDNVMQDLLTRWHRMLGDNTLWMPGTDHAGIATQAVVEKRLKELEDKTRHDIGREGLVQRIWAWKDQYQARIVEQQQRMGCSCDWQRQRFTMDAVCTRAVRHAFFRLFSDGLIYRGKRLVNWDVQLQTSVSDDEVYHETVKGSFWHLRYPVVDPQPGEPDAVIVATTRPETMLGDTAVAVHPEPDVALEAAIDKTRQALERAAGKERVALQAELDALEQRRETVLPTLLTLRDMARQGRMVRLPLLDRPIPLICDAWAKPELGSGCVKITPAHDPNDYGVWTRHRNEIDAINILNTDGTLNAAAGPYAGLDRYAARERVVADLERLGLLEAVEAREIDLGHSDRSKTPVEPFLSDQWFVRMGDVPNGVAMGRGTAKEHRSAGLVQAAMDAVTDGRVRIHPERYTKTYLDWLGEKRDWPISRQLWWGHRIPVWSKRGLRSELNGPEELNELLQVATRMSATSPMVSVKVHVLDGGGESAADETASIPAATWETIAPEATCSVDVCLLGDNPQLVGMLEALDYCRDEDVLDTWFSSALWPFSTLGWPDSASANELLDPGQAQLSAATGDDCLSYYYPGSCLVTGRDIITLWVARMILAGLYTQGDVPFRNVFIHANILDGKGERMSKSKGNGIDPVDIIETYGTDAMRYVLCDMQTGTQDIRLPVTVVCPRCEHHNDLARTKTGKSIFIRICGNCQGELDVLGTMPDLPAGKLISERFEEGRAFCTKLWNSARFVLSHIGSGTSAGVTLTADELADEDRWILDQLQQATATMNAGLGAYNPSVALNAARELFWGAFCDWYLELVKPRLARGDERTAQVARSVLSYVLDQVLRLLHPFVPFITEHLWQRLNEIADDRSLGAFAPLPTAAVLITAAWPQPNPALESVALRSVFAEAQALTRAVRDVRLAAGLPTRDTVKITVVARPQRHAEIERHAPILRALAGVAEYQVVAEAVRTPGSAVKLVEELQLFVHNVIDDAAERGRLEQQLAKVRKEVDACQRKLSNSGFVDRAPPEVVEEQRARLAQHQANVEIIERSLAALG